MQHIPYHPLSYSERLDTRRADVIDLVVIHCTELPDLELARAYGETVQYQGSRTGNSGHYYIDRDGTPICWVEPLRVAHHAGPFNERSIGIELVNHGRWPDWHHSEHQEMSEPYPQEQIRSLLKLLEFLSNEFPSLQWIAGHENLDRDRVPASDRPELSVLRKMDPGPMFPWDQVMNAVDLERFPVEEKT
jgi:N-acetylmuramoyl-L-alanine amidase